MSGNKSMMPATWMRQTLSTPNIFRDLNYLRLSGKNHNYYGSDKSYVIT